MERNGNITAGGKGMKLFLQEERNENIPKRGKK